MVEELKEIVSNSEISKDINLFNDKLKYLLNTLIQSDLASLFVYDSKTHNLNLKLFYNRQEGTLENLSGNDKSLSMVNPQGCIGKAFLTKSSAIHNYITSDKDYLQSYDNELNYKLKSQLIYPLMDNDELIGIFRLSTTINSTLKKYTSKEIAFVNAAAPYLVKIIKNIISHKNIDINDFPDKSNIVDIKEETSIDDNNMLLFLSNTVHDIRTPANSLYGFLELLENQIEDKRLKEFVINAKESASFINTLTDSILETAKSRYQSTLTNEVAVCPIKFLSGIANTFSAKMLEKKIHYFIFIDPNIPKEIKVDTLKLKRILTNLIGNAYKFTPIKNQINLQILWDESNSRIKFSVKDTGIGIEEKDQKKLFKAFSQARDDINHKYGGTGLGLAISAGYVSEMGGELKLKSRPDEGSEFYFDIPVEVIDNSPSYEKFYDLEKKILILTDYTQAKYPRFIQNYLMALGMPKEKIVISDTIEDDFTHVICFEEKITSDILEAGTSKQFKLLLIEQKLFSLLNKKEVHNIHMTSKNIYNADAIYSTVFSGKKLKVLIVDDNKINVTLLESMLAGEYLDISTSLDGEEALKTLKENAKEGNSFDIIYLDKHMEGMSGSELLHKYRKFEGKHALKPIFGVSISGDPEIDEEEKKLYDAFVHKPFGKNDVQEVISLFKK
jgi:signal transduction histidine kinase/CheY-like chemotaxis protein